MNDWVPGWWEFALLAAAAFRLWKLLAEDTILDRPRKWALGLPRSFDPERDDVSTFRGYRDKLATFITCPWCAGFWIVLLLYVLWLLLPTATLAVSVPLALSATVGLTAALAAD